MPQTHRRSSSILSSRTRSRTKSRRSNKTSSVPSLTSLIRTYDKYFHKNEHHTRSQATKVGVSVSAGLKKAIQALPQCPLQEVDLNALYPQGPDKVFGAGRSGAYVFRIPTKKGPLLLKYYADAYRNPPNLDKTSTDKTSTNKTQPYVTKNPRPFREVICLQALFGIPGFPVVGAMHCARLPVSWLQQFGLSPHIGDLCGLTITMSLAPGVSLASLDLPLDQVKRTRLGRGICCRLLYLLDRAKRVLGYSFQHNDLHPGNIIVDRSTTVTTTLNWTDSRNRTQSYTIRGPQVTIIDFDLSDMDGVDFQNAIRASRTSWVQSGWMRMTNTMRAYKPFNRPSLRFIRKHKTTASNTIRAFQHTYGIHSVDLRNLILITSVFSS